MTTTECKKCNTHKQEHEFYLKDRAAGRLDTTCKACRIIILREKNLGVTQADYLKMYTSQNGKCGICERRLYSKRYKAFCVDHDHKDGHIRGLLCHNCNGAIGMLQDDESNLLRAIEWLRRDSPCQ